MVFHFTVVCVYSVFDNFRFWNPYGPTYIGVLLLLFIPADSDSWWLISLCFVIFICELRVVFFPLHLCVSWMLSSKEELCLLFLRAMGCYWPGTFSFLSSIQGPLLHPGFSGSNMSFLPALWFSAFIIRPTLEIFLILWVPDNTRNNMLYAESSVLLRTPPQLI